MRTRDSDDPAPEAFELIARQKRRPLRLCWTMIAAANVATVVLILHSQHFAIYDEVLYLRYLDVLQRDGLSAEFLRQLPAGAGPLFAVVYAPLKLIFGLGFPALRLVSYTLFIVATLVLWRIVAAGRSRDTDNRAPVNPGLFAAAFTVLPTTAVSAGLMLTEVPALVMMMLALLAIESLVRRRVQGAAANVTAGLGGLAIGLAALGRQNYLVVLPCLPLLLNGPGPSRRDVSTVAILLGAAAAVVTPVIVIWGGVIPPNVANIGAGLSLAHGLLALGYGGIVTGLLAPALYRTMLSQKTYAATAFALAFAATLAIGGDYLPLRSLTARLAGAGGPTALAFALTFVIATAAICYLIAMALYVRGRWHDPLTRFYGCVALVGLLSNAKMTATFSSRYVFVFLPFIVLALRDQVRLNWHLPLRLALGTGLSLAGLASYLT